MEKHSEMIVRAVRKFLGGMGINYELYQEDGFCFSIGFPNCKIDPIDIQILPLTKLIFYMRYRPSRQGRTGGRQWRNLSCRANYGLLANGNFELDMDDGEIRYKVFIDCRCSKTA